MLAPTVVVLFYKVSLLPNSKIWSQKTGSFVSFVSLLAPSWLGAHLLVFSCKSTSAHNSYYSWVKLSSTCFLIPAVCKCWAVHKVSSTCPVWIVLLDGLPVLAIPSRHIVSVWCNATWKSVCRDQFSNRLSLSVDHCLPNTFNCQSL